MSDSRSHDPSFSWFYEAMIVGGVEQRSWADCCVCHQKQQDESGTAFILSDRSGWLVVCATCLPRVAAKLPRSSKERIGPPGELRCVYRADETLKVVFHMDTAADQCFLAVLGQLAATQSKQ